MTLQGITEDEIANYLVHTPAFFERNANLLSSIQLTSPHGQRAVSLQERQMEMLRDKIRGLEKRIMEMIRHSQDNEAIADRLQRWVRTVLLAHDNAFLTRQCKQRVARDAGKDRAAKRRRLDGAIGKDEEQVHAPQFLDPAPLGRVKEDDLVEPHTDGFGLRDEACSIVAAALGGPRSAGRGAGMVLRDPK